MTLQVQALVKHFDGVKAVRGITFSVDPGECVALIGPNGAGKSTSFACIAGQHRPTSGSVHWNGERIDCLSPASRLQRGVARSFQVAQTFEALTVLQNVQLLTLIPRGLHPLNDLSSQNSQPALRLLEQVDLVKWAQAEAMDLPYGAKKRLELAMALAGLEFTPAGRSHARPVGPGLLLLDEPAAGLAASERADVMQLVKSLTLPSQGRVGAAVLYTEHNMDAVFGVADRVLVLIDGVIAAQGTPQDIARNPTVRQRYLGQGWPATQEALDDAVVPSAAAEVQRA